MSKKNSAAAKSESTNLRRLLVESAHCYTPIPASTASSTQIPASLTNASPGTSEDGTAVDLVITPMLASRCVRALISATSRLESQDTAPESFKS